MADKFMLTIHHIKEGRISVQFFPSAEVASDRAKLMQETFRCDVYVSEILSKSFAKRGAA